MPFFPTFRNRISTLALALLTLLAPYGAAVSELLAGTDTECGMACCRKAKSCCCRGNRLHINHSSSPQWRGEAGCAGSCRQPTALTRGISGLVFDIRPAAAPSPAVRLLLPPASFLFVQQHVETALFERPPPACS